MAPKKNKDSLTDSRDFVQNAPKGSAQYLNFDDFWFKIKLARHLSEDLKPVLLAHFKAAGFMSPERFDAGLKHFGL